MVNKLSEKKRKGNNLQKDKPTERLFFFAFEHKYQHVHAGKTGPHNQHIQTVCHDLLPNLAAPPQGHDPYTLPRPDLGQSWEY